MGYSPKGHKKLDMTEENSTQEAVWGESFKNTVGDLMPRTLGEEPPALGT